MATIFAKGPVTVTFNDVVVNRYLTEQGYSLPDNPELEFTITIGPLEFVRARPVARQSCLWRHSFDWRNRQRGHPLHRVK